MAAEPAPKQSSIRTVRGADLPPAWMAEAGVAPDETVIVEIMPRTAALAELEELMDAASDEWAANGGTMEEIDVGRAINPFR